MTPYQQDDLDRARALARALADDLARARRALADDRDLHRARARAFEQAHDRALDLAHVLDRVRARAFDHALDHADGLDLTVRLDRTLTLTLTLARDLADAPVLDRAFDLAADLIRVLDRVLDRARDLMRTVDQVADPGRSDRGVLPARRLVAAAAGLVPAGERVRYGEEWRSELHDLAASGAGRCQQLGYAVRLLAGTPRLRRAVLAPRREKAGP